MKKVYASSVTLIACMLLLQQVRERIKETDLLHFFGKNLPKPHCILINVFGVFTGWKFSIKINI